MKRIRKLLTTSLGAASTVIRLPTKLLVVAPIAAALASASPGAAQTQTRPPSAKALAAALAVEASLCAGEGNTSIEQQIAACTRLIKLGANSTASAGAKAKSNLAWAYVHRGSAYTDGRDYVRAIADYDAAIKLDKKSAEAYSGRGLANYYRGAFDQAIQDENQAVALSPKAAGPYRVRGYAHLKSDDPISAVADFTAALDIHSLDATALFGRAAAYAVQGRRAFAQRDVAAARGIDPNIRTTVRDLFDYEPPPTL
jgi:tetratricopeptide (TPR) repeat protein